MCHKIQCNYFCSFSRLQVYILANNRKEFFLNILEFKFHFVQVYIYLQIERKFTFKRVYPIYIFSFYLFFSKKRKKLFHMISKSTLEKSTRIWMAILVQFNNFYKDLWAGRKKSLYSSINRYIQQTANNLLIGLFEWLY